MSKLHVSSSTKVFDHPWERIYIEHVQTDAGAQFDYLISEPNDFVVIVPLLPDGKRVLMVRQYKHGAQQELLGFPAGFKEPDESAEDCARRELQEEVNYTADSFVQVATLSENPTRCRNHYYIVIAKGARPRTASPVEQDVLEGQIQTEIHALSELYETAVLERMKAGPMLSALPFLSRQI